ncbi:C-type lectin domain family 4 member M-like isoform X2 [Cheilinus undulatus]|uniref:C-type lectin domain family 4 member M-like isoform X2 n=1 Tax=Cheilinus undulatus TaxID=241271 RepID=UPI001BD3EDFE|nr:C-type lectin domain family 4 member M-like isoform X2 [Cheilinus undulatus]
MDLMEIDDSVHMKTSLIKDGLVTKDYTFIKPMSADLIQTANSTGEQLKAALSNVTKDKEQLQKSYNTLKQEKDQLQTNYKNLTQIKNQLENSYQSLSKDKDALQLRCNTLQRDKDQLRSDYTSLETVKDQLEKKVIKVRGDLTRERDALQESYNTLKQEKDQLQTNYNSTQRNLNNLQREKNDLQTQFNTMRTNRDELQTSNAALKSEKDQLQRSKDSLQSQFNTLQREKDQLRADYNNLTQVRDQLQQRVNALVNSCPGGWRKFDGGSCFYVSTQRRTWYSSRDFCISQGGRLAILNNRDKMMFVNGLLRPGVEAWIGLTDSGSEGTWKWVDGSIITTTFWQSGQPNSWGGNQDCGEIVQKGNIGEWNDEGCSSENVCVCEIPV